MPRSAITAQFFLGRGCKLLHRARGEIWMSFANASGQSQCHSRPPRSSTASPSEAHQYDVVYCYGVLYLFPSLPRRWRGCVTAQWTFCCWRHA